MLRMTGFFTILPAAILLTISYFVLFTARKLEPSDRLRGLARFVAGLLWLAMALVLAMGAYIVTTGNHPLVAILRELGGE